MNKTIQTLNVSDNSFGKMQVGDQVKLQSSGEMCSIVQIWIPTAEKLRVKQDGKDSDWIQTSDFEDKNITIHADQLRQNTVDTLDYSGQGLHVDGGTFIVAELLKSNASVTKVSH